MKDMIILERVSCIYYLVLFQKENKKLAKALIDSNSEVNAMNLVYVKQLGL